MSWRTSQLCAGWGPSGANPTKPTISIADNGDGTGVVVTVTGSEAGSTNTFYYTPYDGSIDGTETYTDGGDCTGDDDIAVAIATTGKYFGYVNSLSSTSGGDIDSNGVTFWVTDSATAILMQILEAVQERIIDTELEDVADASVVILKLPIDRVLTANPPIVNRYAFPAVFITPENESGIGRQRPVFQRDDVYYQIQVTLLDADNQEPTLQADLNRLLLWRQKVSRAFRSQRLAGLNLPNCIVTPRQQVLPEAWRNNWLATALTLTFFSREPRGL